MNDRSSEPKLTPCIGCGHCCRKAPCAAAMRLYGKIINKDPDEIWRCPALIWREEEGRYFCQLCLGDSVIANDYRRELAVGQGCCSNLNSDRLRIPRPSEFEPTKAYVLPREVQLLIVNMSRQFCTLDALCYALEDTAKEIGEPEFLRQAIRLIKENRRSCMDSFFGDSEVLGK